MGNRAVTLARETGETKISVEFVIDGRGRFEIETGVKMFDHMLSHIAQHGLLDIKLKASGWDQHHLVEDVAIALGKALSEALGDKKGIVRMGHALVPMDEALAMVAVDISGRGYAMVEAPFKRKKLGDMESDLVSHFLKTIAAEGRLNLHVRLLSGTNDHHMAEAIFKALGQALRQAVAVTGTEIPSTKGTL